MHNAINSRLNLENSCYHSDQNVFFFFLFLLEKSETQALQQME